MILELPAKMLHIPVATLLADFPHIKAGPYKEHFRPDHTAFYDLGDTGDTGKVFIQFLQ